MNSLSYKIIFGTVFALAIGLFCLFIYGLVTKDIEGGNFYFFKSNTGDVIVGGISIAGGILTFILGVWYYISHKKDFQEEHFEIHNEYIQDNEGSNLMDKVQKKLVLKNINIFIIFILFSFFFILMGVSCFLNEESTPSIFQAYERPCPKNTVPANAQKHPKDL